MISPRSAALDWGSRTEIINDQVISGTSWTGTGVDLDGTLGAEVGIEAVFGASGSGALEISFGIRGPGTGLSFSTREAISPASLALYTYTASIPYLTSTTVRRVFFIPPYMRLFDIGLTNNFAGNPTVSVWVRKATRKQDGAYWTWDASWTSVADSTTLSDNGTLEQTFSNDGKLGTLFYIQSDPNTVSDPNVVDIERDVDGTNYEEAGTLSYAGQIRHVIPITTLGDTFQAIFVPSTISAFNFRYMNRSGSTMTRVVIDAIQATLVIP